MGVAYSCNQRLTPVFLTQGDNCLKSIFLNFGENVHHCRSYMVRVRWKRISNLTVRFICRGYFPDVPIISQFASLECKHGETERGATMFEKLIAEFPKRSDVMSVYIDMVVRTGDMDRAR